MLNETVYLNISLIIIIDHYRLDPRTELISGIRMNSQGPLKYLKYLKYLKCLQSVYTLNRNWYCSQTQHTGTIIVRIAVRIDVLNAEQKIGQSLRMRTRLGIRIGLGLERIIYLEMKNERSISKIFHSHSELAQVHV